MENVPTWVTQLQAFGIEEAGRILLAGLLGAIIGYERGMHGRSAGLRTNTLIALASCLFTVLSIEFFVQEAGGDIARVAAQIVSGVGFLGAGALFRSEDRMRGLTTAATIWLVAAVGMAVGAAAYFLAIFTTLVATTILFMLRPVSHHLHADRRSAQSTENLDE